MQGAGVPLTAALCTRHQTGNLFFDGAHADNAFAVALSHGMLHEIACMSLTGTDPMLHQFISASPQRIAGVV